RPFRRGAGTLLRRGQGWARAGDAHARDRALAPRRARQRSRTGIRRDAHVGRRRRQRARRRVVPGHLRALRQAADATVRTAVRDRSAGRVARELRELVRDRAGSDGRRRRDGDLLMERRLRALDVARRAGAEALLVSTPAAVAWLTGFAAEVDSGPSPFSLPPLALLSGDGAPVLIVSDDDAEGAAATGCDVRSYRGFSVEPFDAVGGASRALAEVAGRRRVGVEAVALPAALAADLDWVDVGTELARARAVKDADELPLIRAAIELCDVGQREARLRAEPGLTELELWARVRGAIESAAGARTPILADLVAGPRTAATGGAPENRTMAEGELVICDLVPRRAGYWGGPSATFAPGDPSP